MPPEMLDWEGKWLVRMVSPPLSQLITDGIKKCEIMPVSDWITWGAQGVIITAIYQGAQEIGNLQQYVPRRFRHYAYDRGSKGKIMSVLVLGACDSPSREEDSGWFSTTSPRGGRASMHRVLARFSLPTPYTPICRYTLGGGFMLLHDADVKGLCIEMAKCILNSPGGMLFTQDGQCGRPADIFGRVPSLEGVKVIASLSLPQAVQCKQRREIAYPAQQELLREYGSTPSPYRVRRMIIKGVDSYRLLPAVFIERHIKSVNHVWLVIWAREHQATPINLSERIEPQGEDHHFNWPGPIAISSEGEY